MTNEALWFVLPVNPQPWKVGEAYVIRKGGLRAGVGPNRELQSYQEAIREALLVDYAYLFEI
jgi:hypothetical protein